MRKVTFSNTLIFASAIFICLSMVMMPSCSQKSEQGERFISSSDSAYSEDVRSISERINNSPDDASLYATRANTFYYEENYNEAILDIDRALVLAPSNPVYHFRKGEYLLSLDSVDSKAVKKSLKKSIELKPDFSEAILVYSKLLIARMEYKEADIMLSKALHQDNTNAKAYFLRGISKKEQKDTATAIDQFNKAITYDDNYFEAVLQIGDLYAAQNNERALLYFDKALVINEFSADAYYSKGLFLQRKEQYKDAMALYENTVKLNPGYRLAYYNMAFIMLKFENYSDAHEQLDNAIEVDPNYDNAYHLKGVCYEKQGNMEAAKEYYNKALTLNPEHPFAKRDLQNLDEI
jgi:tetratricopeptide (TPR) repeat protein